MKIISFSSDFFKPCLPDECQVDRNVLGFELAYWLAQQLLKKGIVTSYPESFNLAWALSWYDDGSREMKIFCGGSFDESKYQWSIYLHESKFLFSKRKISDQEIDGFYQIISSILKENDISAIVEDE